jgi:thiol-disulfide isomerase/thioredoxin
MKRNGLLGAVVPAILATAIGPADPAAFHGAVAWLDSKPLTLGELRGRVVLVDCWTYTCVNWRRTLPYVRAWAKKYGPYGLTVIGAHTPEFSFEKKIDNIRRAIKEMDVDYPVAVDSNYAIWNAFNNQYWPAVYLIDAHGQIRWQHFGEGAYDETERAIAQLLTESGRHGFDQNPVTVEPRGLEVAADWNDERSAETYVGYDRGTPRVFAEPVPLKLNEWALYGNWSAGKEAAALNKPGGRIAYRFHARDVNLIMGPQRPGATVRFRVLVDGQPPGANHGGDVDADGYGKVTRQDTYQLIRQGKPIVDRLFEIEFLDAGVEAYDFTFG